MEDESIPELVKRIAELPILTRNGKYFLEAGILLCLAIAIVNSIAPSSNAIYFLLIIPAILLLMLFGFIIIKILQRPELGIPVIALMLPFERIGALSSSSFNVRLSQVFTVIAFIAYIFYTAYTDKKNKFGGIKIKRDTSFLLLIIFAIINIASLAIAVNKGRSLYVLIFDLFIFFVYIFVSNLLVSKDILKKTVWIILGISFVLCLYGIFQFGAGELHLPESISGLLPGYSIGSFAFPRIQATETEPQFWGNFLIIPVCLSLSLIFSTIHINPTRKKDRINKRLIFTSMLVFILGIINILLTFSRGTWFAIIGSIFIITVINFRRIFTPQLLVGIVVLATFAIVGFSTVLTYTKSSLDVTSLLTRAQAVTDTDRTLTTVDALSFFSAHEILGIGVGSFGPYEAANIYQEPQAYGENIGWRIVNNEYIEILTETGLLGIFTFALFILYLGMESIIALRKITDTYTRAILIGLIAAFVGMLIQYWAFSTLYVMDIWFLFAILNAVAFNINTNLWT